MPEKKAPPKKAATKGPPTKAVSKPKPPPEPEPVVEETPEPEPEPEGPVTGPLFGNLAPAGDYQLLSKLEAIAEEIDATGAEYSDRVRSVLLNIVGDVSALRDAIRTEEALAR